MITADVGGAVYGCPDPDPITLRFRKGTSANRWNWRGFRAVRRNAAVGDRARLRARRDLKLRRLLVARKRPRE